MTADSYEHRRWCQTIAFCRHSNTGRRSHTIWRQNFLLRQHLCSSWNSIPSDIRQPDLSYGQFRPSLKTFSFWAVGPRCSATCVNCVLEALLLTYLLTYNVGSRVSTVTLSVVQSKMKLHGEHCLFT